MTTLELWFNSGNATFPFERITGAVARVGTCAPHSGAIYEKSLFFLDENRKVRVSKGLDPVTVSTPQIEYKIQQFATVTDAIGYIIPYEGHVFYVLNFPTSEFPVTHTFVYDITTNLWSQWTGNSATVRFRGNCYSYFNYQHLIGDRANGHLLELDNATYQDYSANAITRRIVTRSVSQDNRYLLHRGIEIDAEPGEGELALKLTWSDDAGHNFSTGSTITIANADYDGRFKWHRLGYAKNRIYKLETTSNAKVVIKGTAYGDIHPMNRR